MASARVLRQETFQEGQGGQESWSIVSEGRWAGMEGEVRSNLWWACKQKTRVIDFILNVMRNHWRILSWGLMQCDLYWNHIDCFWEGGSNGAGEAEGRVGRQLPWYRWEMMVASDIWAAVLLVRNGKLYFICCACGVNIMCWGVREVEKSRVVANVLFFSGHAPWHVRS